jgi:hypothetical protein
MPSTDIQNDLLDATQIRGHLAINFHYYNSIASGNVLFALGSSGHRLVVIGSRMCTACVHVKTLSKPIPSSAFKPPQLTGSFWMAPHDLPAFYLRWLYFAKF